MATAARLAKQQRGQQQQSSATNASKTDASDTGTPRGGDEGRERPTFPEVASSGTAGGGKAAGGAATGNSRRKRSGRQQSKRRAEASLLEASGELSSFDLDLQAPVAEPMPTPSFQASLPSAAQKVRRRLAKGCPAFTATSGATGTTATAATPDGSATNTQVSSRTKILLGERWSGWCIEDRLLGERVAKILCCDDVASAGAQVRGGAGGDACLP